MKITDQNIQDFDITHESKNKIISLLQKVFMPLFGYHSEWLVYSKSTGKLVNNHKNNLLG
jgi:hypothetical protein